MRFHVVSLPHTQTTKDFGQCAYTQKVRKFCNMMMAAGHSVYLYASDQNEAKCTELITCITKEQQNYFLDDAKWWPDQYYKIPYKDTFPIWEVFNNKVVLELKKRVQQGDIVCQIAGKSQEVIMKSFPYNTVEFGVGYEGIIAKYRVFESYAWMHHVYGLKQIKDGAPTDTVIWNYFEPEDFTYRERKENYLLFMSRPVRRKGLQIALEIAKKTGYKLVVAGAEKVEGDNVEWVGYADPKKRADLMSRASALLCPTLYIEPFGGVVAEAALCGTPAITTDWGAFTEIVEHGVTGFRCRSMNDFIKAANNVAFLSNKKIREKAEDNFSVGYAMLKYNEYFIRLQEVIKNSPLI